MLRIEQRFILWSIGCRCRVLYFAYFDNVSFVSPLRRTKYDQRRVEYLACQCERPDCNCYSRFVNRATFWRWVINFDSFSETPPKQGRPAQHSHEAVFCFRQHSKDVWQKVFWVKHAHAKPYLCVLYLSKCRRRGFTNNLWAGFWVTWSCTAEEDFTKHNLPILLDGKAYLELGHVMMHWNRETSSHALQYKKTSHPRVFNCQHTVLQSRTLGVQVYWWASLLPAVAIYKLFLYDKVLSSLSKWRSNPKSNMTRFACNRGNGLSKPPSYELRTKWLVWGKYGKMPSPNVGGPLSVLQRAYI